MPAQVAQMVFTVRQEIPSGNLLTADFAKGQHVSFWAGANQKARALQWGHSQRWRSEAVIVLLLSCTLLLHHEGWRILA